VSSLLINPRLKNICLVFSFIGYEYDISIAEEYDRKSIYLMLMKYYHHLHPLVNNGNVFVRGH
jgi:hypothetical protein